MVAEGKKPAVGIRCCSASPRLRCRPFVHLGGFVPGDDAGAHRSCRQRQGRHARGLEGERHRRPADPRWDRRHDEQAPRSRRQARPRRRARRLRSRPRRPPNRRRCRRRSNTWPNEIEGPPHGGPFWGGRRGGGGGEGGSSPSCARQRRVGPAERSSECMAPGQNTEIWEGGQGCSGGRVRLRRCACAIALFRPFALTWDGSADTYRPLYGRR